MTKKLWDTAMTGNVTAMIFWLKNNAGWRDVQPETNVTVTVAMQEWEKQRERQRELTRLLTIEEKRIYQSVQPRACPMIADEAWVGAQAAMDLWLVP